MGIFNPFDPNEWKNYRWTGFNDAWVPEIPVPDIDLNPLHSIPSWVWWCLGGVLLWVVLK